MISLYESVPWENIVRFTPLRQYILCHKRWWSACLCIKCMLYSHPSTTIHYKCIIIQNSYFSRPFIFAICFNKCFLSSTNCESVYISCDSFVSILQWQSLYPHTHTRSTKKFHVFKVDWYYYYLFDIFPLYIRFYREGNYEKITYLLAVFVGVCGWETKQAPTNRMN